MSILFHAWSSIPHIKAVSLKQGKKMVGRVISNAPPTHHVTRLLLPPRCVHITDIGVGYISTMLSLSALFLRWCSQVRDFGLQHLCGMRNLQVLSLAGKLANWWPLCGYKHTNMVVYRKVHHGKTGMNLSNRPEIGSFYNRSTFRGSRYPTSPFHFIELRNKIVTTNSITCMFWTEWRTDHLARFATHGVSHVAVQWFSFKFTDCSFM
jgi:hypothetical protein